MQNRTISLIIPAYNEEKYIGPCLEYAIKNSQDKISEIIVVDNASTDRTAEIAKTYGVKVVTETQKGVMRARQRGIDESHGEIVAFVDADTRMPEGWCETIGKEFSSHPNLACLSGPYAYYDTSSFQNFLVRIYNWVLVIPAYLFFGYMAIFGNLAIRRNVLEKMNGLDTSIEFYGDDANTARRASKFGKMKFKMSFVMYTSGRRFTGQGIFKTAFLYVLNYLSEVFRHRPATAAEQMHHR